MPCKQQLPSDWSSLSAVVGLRRTQPRETLHEFHLVHHQKNGSCVHLCANWLGLVKYWCTDVDAVTPKQSSHHHSEGDIWGSQLHKPHAANIKYTGFNVHFTIGNIVGNCIHHWHETLSQHWQISKATRTRITTMLHIFAVPVYPCLRASSRFLHKQALFYADCSSYKEDNADCEICTSHYAACSSNSKLLQPFHHAKDYAHHSLLLDQSPAVLSWWIPHTCDDLGWPLLKLLFRNQLHHHCVVPTTIDKSASKIVQFHPEFTQVQQPQCNVATRFFTLSLSVCIQW